MTQDTPKYGLQQGIEHTVVALCCLSDTVFMSLGQHVDPTLLDTAVGRLTLQAAQSIYKDTEQPPTSAEVIVQRLLEWSNRGHAEITDTLLYEVVSLLGNGLPPMGQWDQLTADVIRVVKARKRWRFVMGVLDAYNNDQDFDPFIDGITDINSVGRHDSTPAVTFGNSFEAIARMAGLQRLPTGIVDLDNHLSGGLPRGSMGIVLGSSAAGKSVLIGQFAMAAVAQRKRTALLSMELPPEWIYARTNAGLIGWDIDQVIKDPFLAKQAVDGLNLGMERDFVVQEFPADVTVHELIGWLYRHGPFDVVVVDYMDLVLDGTGRKAAQSTYLSAKAVANRLRNFARDTKAWMWTASQTNRRQKGKAQPLTLDDVADSMHKVRIADIVLGININKDLAGVLEADISVLKHRLGKAHGICGPYEPQFAGGLLAPSRFFVPRTNLSGLPLTPC